MATLLVANPNGDPWRMTLPDNGILKIGRKPDNDVVIDNPHVSLNHAEIRSSKEGYFIKDLDSHNGTRVNGENVSEEVGIKEGDKMVFGILEAALLPEKQVRSMSPTHVSPSVQSDGDREPFQPTQIVASLLEQNKAKREDTGRVDAMCKEIIKRLDLIDDMLERYRTVNKDEDMVNDLTLIKQSFQDILVNYEVEAYSFDPETEINIEMRKRIKVVETVKAPKINGSSSNASSTNRIIQTLHEGYMRRLEGSNPVILRKAHVTTRTQLVH